MTRTNLFFVLIWTVFGTKLFPRQLIPHKVGCELCIIGWYSDVSFLCANWYYSVGLTCIMYVGKIDLRIDKITNSKKMETKQILEVSYPHENCCGYPQCTILICLNRLLLRKTFPQWGHGLRGLIWASWKKITIINKKVNSAWKDLKEYTYFPMTWKVLFGHAKATLGASLIAVHMYLNLFDKNLNHLTL